MCWYSQQRGLLSYARRILSTHAVFQNWFPAAAVAQARRNRPVREMTCDEVARSLSRQEALLANLLHKLQRGSALVAVDSSKLQDVRQRVARSLSDKVGPVRSGPATCLCPDALVCHQGLVLVQSRRQGCYQMVHCI